MKMFANTGDSGLPISELPLFQEFIPLWLCKGYWPGPEFHLHLNNANRGTTRGNHKTSCSDSKKRNKTVIECNAGSRIHGHLRMRFEIKHSSLTYSVLRVFSYGAASSIESLSLKKA